MATVAVTLPWLAKQAIVKVAEAVTTVTATSLLDTVQTSAVDFTGVAKDISITGGGRDVDKIDLLGINQILAEKRPDLVEVAMTLIFKGDLSATNKDPMLWATGAAATEVTGSYMRSNMGEKTSSDRTKKSVLLTLRQGTTTNDATVNILVNNCYAVSAPELTLNADGDAESKVTFKGLAKDVYMDSNVT